MSIHSTARIHPTAEVHPEARLDRDVEVGARAVIGPHVTLGKSCLIMHHATVDGYTVMGDHCQVFPYAAIGLAPQDVKYRGGETWLRIGSRNVFREYVTVHPGTEAGGGETLLGDGNLLLIGTHVAHDCRVGNRCILANYTQLAGHVRLEDHVNMGGMAALHHFVTVGRHAFVGGMTRVTADVPPYMIVVAARGTRPEVRMVNSVGLQRCGYSEERILALRRAYMRIWSRRARQSGVSIRDRVMELLKAEAEDEHVRYLCEFLLRSFEHGRHGRYLESLRGQRPGGEAVG